MSRNSLLAACWLCAAFALISSPAARGEEQNAQVDLYWQYVKAGDTAQALQAGRAVMSALEAANPDSATLKSIEERFRSVRDARARILDKLGIISAGSKAGRPGAFAYVTPTPRELYDEITRKFGLSRPSFSGLSEAGSAFAASYLATALSGADADALKAYKEVMAAGADDKAVAKTRGYLAAYILALHDDASLPDALHTAANELSGGKLPIFLAESTLMEVSDIGLTLRILNALDSAKWASWPEGERLRLSKLMADRALATGGYEWAVNAYRAVAAADPASAEQAQYTIIELHSKRARSIERERGRSEDQPPLKTVYADAAADCGKYLQMFPDSPRALTVEYSKVVFEYRAGQYKEAAASAQAFRANHPQAKKVPDVMLVEGLATSDLNKPDDAVKIFEEVIDKYPKHAVAGEAQYMIGHVYFTTQRYAQAKVCFQRVVDFYPKSENVSNAKDLLEKLSQLPDSGAK
jgi:outer membrane protein assembly factor BamD (BamD/ComL family)